MDNTTNTTGKALEIGADCLKRSGNDLYTAFLNNPECAADIVLHAATDALHQGPEAVAVMLDTASKAYDQAMAARVPRC